MSLQIVKAQDNAMERSSATVTAGIGSGSFEGFKTYEMLGIVVSGPGKNEFTNFSMTVRFLFATKELNSRLSLGCELDLQMIEEGGESDYLIYSDGTPVQNPDKMLYAIHFISEYHILSLSERTSIKGSAGAGILFFAHIETRANDESSVQPSASARLSAPIGVSGSITIEPELRMIVSTGQEKVFLLQAMAGLTFYL